jgi:hypothetical protein
MVIKEHFLNVSYVLKNNNFATIDYLLLYVFKSTLR